MRDTRQDILRTAKELFNQQGYNNVTTRDIADALGISKGNLTYHFKKKEDIIEAIVTEDPHTQIPEMPRDLSQLNDYLKDIEKTVRDNAFYFWHHSQFAQVSPKIQALQKTVLDDHAAKLTGSLSALSKDGWIRVELYPGEYHFIVDTLLLLGIYWIPFCRTRAKEGEEDAREGQCLRQLWSTIYPLLTDKGRREAARSGILPEHFTP